MGGECVTKSLKCPCGKLVNWGEVSLWEASKGARERRSQTGM